MNKRLKILDCTLRDGGYYNRWDFSEGLIREYLNVMKICDIDYIEMGFRTLKTNGFKGACAYTSDEFIKDTNEFKKLKIGVMVNASEILDHNSSIRNLVKKLFPNKKKNSPVSLIRFASHINEIKKILPICNFLKNLGYKICINLMQISEIPSESIKNISKSINDSGVDVFYFADSLGSLDDSGVKRIIDKIKFGWNGDIGIHTHDNMERAMSNSLVAIEHGVNWVDATVNGMGRGPGNLKTELALVQFLNYRKNKKIDLAILFELIEKYFNELKLKYKWGTNPYYYYAAQNSIHPTFIQTLLSDNRYGPIEIMSKLKYLSKQDAKKFSLKLLNKNYEINKKCKGTWSPKNEIKNKEVLILGSGPSSLKYKKAIETYIKNKKPYVIGLNTHKSIDEKFLNLRVACHPIRIMSDSLNYNKLRQSFAIPISSQNEQVKKNLKKIKIKNFGLLVKGNKFKYSEKYAETPSILVLGYALAISNSGMASDITLAGFDGYTYDDARMHEVNELIKMYNKNKKSIKLISITPTKYKIDTKSVFQFK